MSVADGAGCGGTYESFDAADLVAGLLDEAALVQERVLGLQRGAAEPDGAGRGQDPAAPPLWRESASDTCAVWATRSFM